MGVRARTIEGTHTAIKKAVSPLNDHHSYFMTFKEVREQFAPSEDDIEQGKSGQTPQLEESKFDSLSKNLEYAKSKLIDKEIGCLIVPSIENLYEQGMRMLADSLQRSIEQLDGKGLKGWIVDLRKITAWTAP